jgi:hypothetical protein
MPLSPPAPRRHLHTRNVIVEGFAREDGLWDIEGRMTDVKTYGFPNQDLGRIEAGEPLHDMRVRLTIDKEMRVHGVEAATEASPFRICPEATPNYGRLVGATVGPGWRKAIREAVGGAQGCTHISELLAAMATVAVQTLYAERERRASQAPRPPGERPKLIDSCYALRAEGEVVKRYWPEFSTGSR